MFSAGRRAWGRGVVDFGFREAVVAFAAGCALAAGLGVGSAAGQGPSGPEADVGDVVARDELIAEQEALLNVYRCLFDVDARIVPGGCSGGAPAVPAVRPEPFASAPTAGEVAVRDRLVAAQEALLNVYRCLFGADVEVVPGGCVSGRPAAAPEEGWYPDPTCRNEVRWWAGGGWSDQVRGRGARSPDPLRADDSVGWASYAAVCGSVGDCGAEPGRPFRVDSDGDGFADSCAAERPAPFTGRVGFGRHAEWSPDGARVLFTAFGQVLVAEADGTAARRIAEASTTEAEAAKWSPDGTKVLYYAGDNSGGELWVVDPDGSRARKVADSQVQSTSGGFDNRIARWSPDSARVMYFTGDWFDSSAESWVVNADGTGRRKVANGIWAKWSPDGGRIAFDGETPPGRHKFFVQNADGTGTQLIADVGHHPTSFAWSPDGAKIAYTSNGIWTASADGTDPRKISEGMGYTHDCQDGTQKSSRAWGLPVWSPDGTRIAFSTTTFSTTTMGQTKALLGVLAVMGSDGSGLRPLATHYQRTDIDWSPDSTAIAFLSTPRTSFVGQGSIVCGTPLSAGSYIVKADGSGLAKIAEQAENPSGAYYDASERSWSPDGTRILVTPLRFPEENEATAIADADGTPMPGLVLDGYYNATWSPDGARILAVNHRPYPGSVWLLDSDAA